ncbi:hypothetical protein AVEN_168439-1 [Araneus ventricosus]|uniref:Uncharacterized protein n=1 Tax=Araneus ventricosus TaxID=182803 RepID=A0A4Y2GQ97_ARAVE|nr:hypothetical protein AVEN_168439-1 [Araneus ventricosus]
MLSLSLIKFRLPLSFKKINSNKEFYRGQFCCEHSTLYPLQVQSIDGVPSDDGVERNVVSVFVPSVVPVFLCSALFSQDSHLVSPDFPLRLTYRTGHRKRCMTKTFTALRALSSASRFTETTGSFRQHAAGSKGSLKQYYSFATRGFGNQIAGERGAPFNNF